MKGIEADGKTGRLYVATMKRVAAFDLTTDKIVWTREYEGGSDRLTIRKVP